MSSSDSAKRVVLISIDGWGITDKTKGNAIHGAKTPHMDAYSKVDNKDGKLYGRIDASGLSVGLPPGMMGNSEVGHLTMGAGRVQYQDLVRINQSIEDKTFADSKTLQNAFKSAKENSNGRLHLLGLVSDGGVHSHIQHLFAFLEAAKKAEVPEVYIHAITDGRDTPPSSGTGYLEQLLEFLKNNGVGKLASVTGRYYAMDRDKRWDRVKIAYEAYATGKSDTESSPDKIIDTVKEKYAKKEEDEFLKPIIVDKDGAVRDGDTLIFFNYRSDRMREIVETFGVKKNFDTDNDRKDLHVFQMTQYDATFAEKGLQIIYPPVDMKNVLAEWLSSKGVKQFHTAETEKYAHVTFFFNGGTEAAFDGEDRKLVPSPKVPTYDKEPEMSQQGVADSVCEAVKSNKYQFIMCNFAAPDMVGHTGCYDPCVIACTKCDSMIEQIAKATHDAGYTLVVTSDHGNAEEMEDDKGNPKTSHTTNYVPFIVDSPNKDVQFEEFVNDTLKQKEKPAGGLSNVAPTILTIMGLDVPKEMGAKSLVKKL